MRFALGYFAIFALLVAGLILLVRLIAPEQIQGEDQQMRLIYLLLLLFLIGGGIFSTNRAQMALALKQALIWIAIFLLVVLAFSFRHDFSMMGNRMAGELMPGKTIPVQTDKEQGSGSTVAITKSNDGHFRANGKVNNTHVRFLVDTGASIIALTLNDAIRAGIAIDKLNYTMRISTASGETFGAPVMLDKVSIGQITLRDVQAVVLKEGLNNSLLGMSFLGRLQKFEASKNQLILKK